jgi:hypothetical protein
VKIRTKPVGTAPGLPRREVYLPPAAEKADIYAMQAVAAGTATPEQQKRALNFIVYDICWGYDWAFRPEGDRETCVALGKQFVGQQIVYLVNLNAAVKFKGSKDAGSEQGR